MHFPTDVPLLLLKFSDRPNLNLISKFQNSDRGRVLNLPGFSIEIKFFFYLDIPDINFVVNFDYPNSGEDYIHRIGRTARAERTGTAYTFFTSANGKNASELIQVMEEAGQTVPPKLLELGGNSYSGRKRSKYIINMSNFRLLYIPDL